MSIFPLSNPTVMYDFSQLYPTAEMSSELGSQFGPARAVGSDTGGNAANGEVAITNSIVERPWFRVQVFESTIFRIIIYARTDCCTTTLRDRNVKARLRTVPVTDTTLNSSILWTMDIRVLFTGQGVSYFPSKQYPTLNLYLSIEKDNSLSRSVHFMEVRVFHKSHPTLNIIANSPLVNQDSTVNAASNAVDGNLGTYSETVTNASPHWWNMFIGAIALEDIEAIHVYFRTTGSLMLDNLVRLRVCNVGGCVPDPLSTSGVVFEHRMTTTSTLSTEPFIYIPVGVEQRRWGQIQKFVGASSGGNFGSSVAVNEDESLMVVGARFHSTSGGFYVYNKLNRTHWKYWQGPIVGSGARYPSNQGYSIAISNKTVVVGSPDDDYFVGKVWVFNCETSPCVEETVLLGSDGIGPTGYTRQGGSIAIYADTVIVGISNANSNAGVVIVFVKSSGVWAQQGGALGVSGSVGLGMSVSIWGDTLFAAGRNLCGVFTRNSGVWTQQGPSLTPSGVIGSNSLFGISTSLQNDRAVVGASNDNGVGAVYVFDRSGSTWSQTARLTGSNPRYIQQLGASVSLWGEFIAVGAPETGVFNSVGKIIIFRLMAGSWREVRRIAIDTADTNVLHGFSVSLRTLGLVSGDPFSSANGVVRVYTIDP